MTARQPARALLPGADEALLRWKLGHHLFHLQLGAMNTLLAAARELLKSASWPELADTFDRLSVLYDGATATMRYAADFSPDMYEQLIRPSMAPPFTSPGFSGTLNLEHVLMLDQLRELRGQFRAIERSGSAPAAACDAAARLWRTYSYASASYRPESRCSGRSSRQIDRLRQGQANHQDRKKRRRDNDTRSRNMAVQGRVHRSGP